MEATTTAQVIQNSLLTDIFILTGEVFWGFVALVGVITIGMKAFRGFVPKKIKGIK